MQVEICLHEIGDLLSWVDELGETGKKAVSYTIKDIKRRAPGWIANEVTSEYNIKKSEIIPAKTEEKKDKQAVSVYSTGQTLETVAIVYRGRRLTPIHFSMSPGKPIRRKMKDRRAIPGNMVNFRPGPGGPVGLVSIYKKYSIRYEVIKGSRWKVRGKSEYETPFLAPVKKGSDKYIVFQRRKGSARSYMYSVRTVSVPQMIENRHVRDKIEQKMMETATQRLQHHIKRLSSSK